MKFIITVRNDLPYDNTPAVYKVCKYDKKVNKEKRKAKNKDGIHFYLTMASGLSARGCTPPPG